MRSLPDAIASFNDDANLRRHDLPWRERAAAAARSLGGHRVIPFPHLFWRHSAAFLPHFALGLPDSFFAERDDVLRAHDLAPDAASRAEYVGQLSRRLLLDESDAPPQRPASEMYFPADLYRLASDEVMVDCGAFDGDTLRSVVAERGADFARLYALEPDPKELSSADQLRRIVAARPSGKAAIAPGCGRRRSRQHSFQRSRRHRVRGRPRWRHGGRVPAPR